jgi:dimethylglycine dehydrogenase
MPGVPNAYEACVFTFGITQGGGAGKVAAEWIMFGETEHDMWAVDPRRYTDYTDQAYCEAKALETYGHEYAMHFPWHEWPAGRDKKLGPNDAKIRELGGVMGAYNGWERANWFAKPGDDTSEESTHTWERSGPWEQRIREECEAVRDACGVLDLPGFSRFWITGTGADEWLRGFVTGGLPKIGRMNLVYVADSRGRIKTEFSCIRVGEDSFILITAATAQWHDGDMIRQSVPEGVSVNETTTQRSALIVTGPTSRDLLTPLTDADLSLPWLSHQHCTVAGHKAFVARVSFAGELGWEVHATNEDMPAIYSAILDAGAKPFGMYALNSLRMEKGYRTWKGDLSTDYSMLEGGLERFVKFDKPQDFTGKAALLAEKQQGSTKQFVQLIVDAGDADAPYMSSLLHDGKVVGEVTSSGYGYRVQASIALGMLRADLAVPGTKLEVDIYGTRVPAVVQGDAPLWDPENDRLRA